MCVLHFQNAIFGAVLLKKGAVFHSIKLEKHISDRTAAVLPQRPQGKGTVQKEDRAIQKAPRRKPRTTGAVSEEVRIRGGSLAVGAKARHCGGHPMRRPNAGVGDTSPGTQVRRLTVWDPGRTAGVTLAVLTRRFDLALLFPVGQRLFVWDNIVRLFYISTNTIVFIQERRFP